MNRKQIKSSKDEVERAIRAYQLGLVTKDMIESKLNCLWVDILLTLNPNDIKNSKFQIQVKK